MGGTVYSLENIGSRYIWVKEVNGRKEHVDENSLFRSIQMSVLQKEPFLRPRFYITDVSRENNNYYDVPLPDCYCFKIREDITGETEDIYFELPQYNEQIPEVKKAHIFLKQVISQFEKDKRVAENEKMEQIKITKRSKIKNRILSAGFALAMMGGVTGSVIGTVALINKAAQEEAQYTKAKNEQIINGINPEVIKKFEEKRQEASKEQEEQSTVQNSKPQAAVKETNEVTNTYNEQLPAGNDYIVDFGGYGSYKR